MTLIAASSLRNLVTAIYGPGTSDPLDQSGRFLGKSLKQDEPSRREDVQCSRNLLVNSLGGIIPVQEYEVVSFFTPVKIRSGNCP